MHVTQACLSGRKPPSLIQSPDLLKSSVNEAGEKSHRRTVLDSLKLEYLNRNHFMESMQIDQTVRIGKVDADDRGMQRPTSWIISCKAMSVVLLSATLSEEDEPSEWSEWSCCTPHPMSASQFRITPGSPPRLFPRVNVPIKRSESG